MDEFYKYYPYQGQEFKHAVRQLVESQYFAQLAPKLFPEAPAEEVKLRLLGLEDVDQFQAYAMMPVCRYIEQHSMQAFTYSGLEHVGQGPCLLVSNHRDITVDAVMTEYVLISHGMRSSHVVIGENLFEMPLMQLMARLNKMYATRRGGSPKEFFENLMEMSHYMRHLVTERGESVWIAQRNGRTKDGVDFTSPSLVKMIAMSGDRRHPAEALEAMHIVPVSISYEWEPCGTMKACEMALRQRGPYAKKPGEDTRSIVAGITDFKGRVHLAFCPPLTAEEIAARKGNADEVARLIDSRIADGFRLWPNHYLGREMLYGVPAAGHCTEEERRRFEAYVAQACRENEVPGFREALLGIYAGALH